MIQADMKDVMKKIVILFFLNLLFLWCVRIDTKNEIMVHYPYTILKQTKPNRNSQISIIKDSKNQLLLVKQKIVCWRNIVSGIHSAVTSKMCRKIPEILCHTVDILDEKSCKKLPLYYPKWKATIHTVVPGKSVHSYERNKFFHKSEVKKLLRGFDVKQKQRGMDLRVIKVLKKHQDLPAAVAFSMIIGDYDCANKNIFYDPESDHFYLIDMDKAFHRDLCLRASHNIMGLIKSHYVWDKEDLISLKKLAKYIKIIIKRNPIEHVIRDAQIFAEKFNLKSKEEKKLLDETIKNMNSFLQESYKSGLQLVALIDQLFLKMARIYNKKGKNNENICV